jgi:hypothetical protein
MRCNRMRRMMKKELTDVNRKRFNRIQFSIGMNKNLALISVMPHAMRRTSASLIDRRRHARISSRMASGTRLSVQFDDHPWAVRSASRSKPQPSRARVELSRPFPRMVVRDDTQPIFSNAALYRVCFGSANTRRTMGSKNSSGSVCASGSKAAASYFSQKCAVRLNSSGTLR